MGQKMNAEYTAFRRREQTSHTRLLVLDQSPGVAFGAALGHSGTAPVDCPNESLVASR